MFFKKRKKEKFDYDYKEKIKQTIDSISEKEKLYKQVLEHIQTGGAATGLVWSISPYMTKDSVEEILEELKVLKIYLKNIYSELMINETLKDIDEDLKDIIKFEFENIQKINSDKLEKNLKLIEEKYSLKN